MRPKLTNKRLLACAELMRETSAVGRRAADIGTDHGYLAAYLVESGICDTAAAADINPGPLDSARRTVAEHGLEDSIDLFLSDGLDSVPRDGVTDIICAGMGGELIADILSRCEWAKECRLYLQPMTKPEFLRQWLFDNGFEVTREVAQRDGRFVYSVMQAGYAAAGLPYQADDMFLAVGLLHPDNADAEEYFRIRIERAKRAAAGMLSADPHSGEAARLLSLAERLENELEERI